MKFLEKLITIIIFVLLACSPTDSRKTNQLPPKINTENLRSVLTEYRMEYDIPALVIGIFTPDTIIIAADGIKDVMTRREINSSDLFHIGSCTKAMTAFVAARLVEKGKLSWNSKISEIFPEWGQNIVDYYKNKTIADLLSHRAGIQPFCDGIELKDVPEYVFFGSKKEKREKFARWLLQREPTIDKTKKYIYSNAGYTLAAVMLEKITKKSWEELIQDQVFAPPGITGKFGWAADTCSNDPLGHIKPFEWGLSDSHDWVILPDSLNYNCDLFEPAGDISMSMVDYCIFLQENLKALTGQGCLLRQSTYRFLHYGREIYSMGWGYAYVRGHHYLSHDGSAGTFYCRNQCCPVISKRLA